MDNLPAHKQGKHLPSSAQNEGSDGAAALQTGRECGGFPIGVDISKDHLDAYHLADGSPMIGAAPGRFAILKSIPGVSKITAFALLIEMPELGTLEAPQAASLAGLAPVARQSGRWTGRAFIRDGRASIPQLSSPRDSTPT